MVIPSFSPKNVLTLEPEVGYSIQNMFKGAISLVFRGVWSVDFKWCFFVFLKGWEHVRCDQNPGYLMHMFFKKGFFHPVIRIRNYHKS